MTETSSGSLGEWKGEESQDATGSEKPTPQANVMGHGDAVGEPAVEEENEEDETLWGPADAEAEAEAEASDEDVAMEDPAIADADESEEDETMWGPAVADVDESEGAMEQPDAAAKASEDDEAMEQPAVADANASEDDEAMEQPTVADADARKEDEAMEEQEESSEDEGDVSESDSSEEVELIPHKTTKPVAGDRHSFSKPAPTNPSSGSGSRPRKRRRKSTSSVNDDSGAEESSSGSEGGTSAKPVGLGLYVSKWEATTVTESVSMSNQSFSTTSHSLGRCKRKKLILPKLTKRKGSNATFLCVLSMQREVNTCSLQNLM